MTRSSHSSNQAANGRPAGGARRLRRALTVATITAGAVVVSVAPANAESFHSSNLLRNFRPWGSPTNSWNVPSVIQLPSGRAVNMKCWTTGAYVDGTAKWFYIQDVSSATKFETGCVPANDVGNQWKTSPHC